MKIKIRKEKQAEINKAMTGLFFEDINYAADGGLYAEMIENRSFESVRNIDNKEWVPDGSYGWSVYPEKECGAKAKIMSEGGICENNPHYMRFTASKSQKGMKNKAYDGIYSDADEAYKVSVWARSDTGAPVFVRVMDGEEICAEAVLAKASEKDWKYYEAEMILKKKVACADFVIGTAPGETIDIDMVSCMPKNSVLGIFRRDLAEMLKAVKPGFLRFPGGCIIEGFNLDNRYRWKDSIGPLEERKENWNRWSGHTTGYQNYNQTLGLGFYEYFLLCEYLGCKPLPVISCTLACQFQTGEMVDFDSAEFDEYIKDALDLIEFANGSADTEYGAMRAKMGHPEPFGLELLSVGNEQWQTEDNRFFQRYERFEAAIHNKYPDIKLVATTGPEVLEERYYKAWEWIRKKSAEKRDFAYVVDEHYYREPKWFYEHIDFYDSYPRDVKVFAGEYASRRRNLPNDPAANTWEAALSEAAYLTMTERNADVVYMQSYAPLFARLGYAQWSPDMIWFNSESCYGSPSYYVQKLYGTNRGDYTIYNDFVKYSQAGIYGSVSYNEEEKTIIIKAANSSKKPKQLEFEISGFSAKSAQGEIITAAPWEFNTISEPKKVSPAPLEILTDNKVNLPAYSFAVIRIKAD